MSKARFGSDSSGVGQQLQIWLAQHLQCGVASLGALWRAPLGTALTSSVIGVALALPLSLYVLVQEASNVSARFGSGFEISAFLRMEVVDLQADMLMRKLARRPDVASVRMIGKEAALAELRTAAGMSAGLEAFAGASPLPVVLVLTPASEDRTAIQDLVAALNELPQVDAVLADQAWLERLRALLLLARRILWLFAAMLGAGVTLVVGNTLRLSVEARREEVEIAKLFGASDAFVRRPFLYQGLLYGIAGALVGCVLVVAGALLLTDPVARLGAEYETTIAVPMPHLTHLAGLVGCGAGLGLLGAWVSVGRHLRAVQPR